MAAPLADSSPTSDPSGDGDGLVDGRRGGPHCELDVPSYLLGPEAVPELQRRLLLSIRQQIAEHCGHARHNQGRRLRASSRLIALAKQIRRRLSDAATQSTVHFPPPGEESNLLSTIALLGTLTNANEGGSFAAILIDSLAHVQWWSISPQSCHDLFNIIDRHTDPASLSEEQRAAIAGIKLDLALRSGRLLHLLRCLLAPASELALEVAPLSSYEAASQVCVSAAAMQDFELQTFVLPPHFHLKDPLTCASEHRGLRFIGSTHMCSVDGWSAPLVHSSHTSVAARPGQRGDVVLYISRVGVLLITAVGRDDRSWYYVARLRPEARELAERVGHFALPVVGLPLSHLQLRFSVRTKQALCCLVACSPPQRARGSMHVAEVSLADLFERSSEEDAVMLRLLPLRRDPCLDAVPTRRKAFHFTNSISVSVGRVTLKDAFHPFCLELWVYPRSVDADQTFLSIGDRRSDEVLIGLEPLGSGVRWYGGARTPRLGFSYATFTSPGKLSVLERWWHVALNFDGAQWELWLNHELVCRQPALVSPAAIADTKCVVGKTFVGMAAEVRVWQHTRTGAQLVRDSRRPLTGAEDGLSGYFPFDEGHDNVIVDHAPRHEHAILPFGEPYWCAVDAFPVPSDPRNVRRMPDFVPLAWIDEADEVAFAASAEAYTVAGTRADGKLCVFDYSCETGVLASQRTVALDSGVRFKCLISYGEQPYLSCCAVEQLPAKASLIQAVVWTMWTYAGQQLASPPPSALTPSTTTACGRAVLQRGAFHARRFFLRSRFLVEQPSWGRGLPPFLLDPDDEVLVALLQLAERALEPSPSQDLALAESVADLLELNLAARFDASPAAFAARIGACYESAEQLVQVMEGKAATAAVGAAGAEGGAPRQLRDQLTRLAVHPCLTQRSTAALLRCCCKCFLSETARIAFLERHASQQRSRTTETVFACLLTHYASLHNFYEMLLSLPAERTPPFLIALFRESVYQAEQALRSRGDDALQRITMCVDTMTDVVLFGADLESISAEREALLRAYCAALLQCCVAIADTVAAALRQHRAAEDALLRCLQRSPVKALLTLSVFLPQLPTSSLEASAALLQRCRESLVVLADQFTSAAAQRWAAEMSLTVTRSLALLGCALVEAKPDRAAATSAAATERPVYLTLLRSGQRKAGTERDALIKNLQGGVGAISRVFDELQRRDVSALRVVRDEELREAERQVMAACCALLLPTSALRNASKESLQPAFQLVLKLRPWVLSRRQESRDYVASMRERAVFLALFEPVAAVEDDTAAAAASAKPPTSAPLAANARRQPSGSIADPNAARVAERRRWQKLFKNWKALHHLKALMASREEMMETNVAAEVVACFQSDVSTAEMRGVVVWRSEKARYRFVGLQLLWQLTTEAHRNPALADELLPVIASALCGRHYADGVDGCSADQLTQLQSAFFHLLRAALQVFADATAGESRSLLVSALLACPFRRADFRRLHSVGLTTDPLRLLWSGPAAPELTLGSEAGEVPAQLRRVTLLPEKCASTMTIGAAGLLLRSSGGSGCCVAPCSWQMPARSAVVRTYYYEVHVIDAYQVCHISIGLGPAEYSLSQMPGWDADSFGFDGYAGCVYANGSSRPIGCMFGMGDVVGCGWDTSAGEVFWTRNGRVVHTLTAAIAAGQVSPLIGLKGRGTVLVNFGASPFVYDRLPSTAASLRHRGKAPPGRSALAAAEARVGWDAFRLFSTRAATALAEAYTQQHELSPTSLAELGQPVGSCVDALVAALSPTALAASAVRPAAVQHVTAVLGQLTVLCKLLRRVPTRVVALLTRSAAARLEEMVSGVLQDPSATAVAGEAAQDAVACLLTAWYHTMYLTPPRVEAASASSGFLTTLLRLAGALLPTAGARLAPAEGPQPPAGVAVLCDQAHWLALALLQRLVNDHDDSGGHAWRLPLHGWLHNAFRACCSAGVISAKCAAGDAALALRDALLGLAVLGGLPRLAVPGDVVAAELGTHCVASAVLLRASWADEVCDVLDGTAVAASGAVPSDSATRSSVAQAAAPSLALKKMPLRLVTATLHGGEASSLSFPDKRSDAHLELANAVAMVAAAWLPLACSAAPLPPEVGFLIAELSCLLARCTERQVISPDPALLSHLSAAMQLSSEVPADVDAVQLELVLGLWAGLQHRQRRGLARNRPPSGQNRRDVAGRPVSSACVGRGLVDVASPASPELTSPLMRLHAYAEAERELADSPGELAMDYDDDNAVGEEEDDEEEDDDEEDDLESAFMPPYTARLPGHGRADELDGETSSTDNVAGPSSQLGVNGRALRVVPPRLSRSSVSSTFVVPLPALHEEESDFDVFHFDGGCISLRRSSGSAPLGSSFAVDVALRVANRERHQIVFAQVVRGATDADAAELVARIQSGRLEFGWMSCLSDEAARGGATPARALCTWPLPEDVLDEWTRFAFVQYADRLALFCNGECVSRCVMSSVGGALLQEPLWIGGVPTRLEATAFVGDMRAFSVYDAALRESTVHALHTLASPVRAVSEAQLVVALCGTPAGLENAAPAALALETTVAGAVACVDPVGGAAWRDSQSRLFALQEVDFGTESEEADLRQLGDSLPFQQCALWRQKRRLSPEQVLAACGESLRQLTSYHSATAIVHAVSRIARSPVPLPAPVLQSVAETLSEEACVAGLTEWLVSPSGTAMAALLNGTWAVLCEPPSTSSGSGDGGPSPNAGALWGLGNRLLAALLRVAQRPLHMASLESSHPQRPFTTVTHEVNAASVDAYSVYVDERSVARWRLLTVSRDRGGGSVVSEFATTVLTAFEVRLPRFFLTIRSAAEGANWGDRLTVVVGSQQQLRAMRLFRTALSAMLRVESAGERDAQAYVWSRSCVAALHDVVSGNISKARLIALTCLSDLYLFAQRIHADPLSMLAASPMQTMRRIAVRHFRRQLPTQRMVGRFVRVGMESYVMEHDLAQSTAQDRRDGDGPRLASAAAPQPAGSAGAEESEEAQRFLRQRQEQLQLYRQRDTVADRITIQKLRNAQSLSHEWISDGICLLTSGDAGGSVAMGVPLTAGRWYFEMRVSGLGNFAVGVLPVSIPDGAEHEAPTAIASGVLQRCQPVAVNGYRALVYTGDGEQRPLGLRGRPLWGEKDYVGIIIDVPRQCLSVMVNGGKPLNVTFAPAAARETGQAAAEAEAVAELVPRTVGDRGHPLAASEAARGALTLDGAPPPMVTAYYPYISLEQADSVTLNFGGTFFEFDVPASCLPLDPAHFSIGTVLPHNQMRALQDMAAHLFSGGRYPLPPFYYEEANPFADSTERSGPAHVSVQASASVVVGTDEVRNNGLDFETVTGDCAVRAGAWYYEVTLRTQGLMQIGWMEKGERVHGNGRGVGDSSTSWAVDLFRRVMWHRGVPEPVNVQRRWNAGDVVGCAIDLTHGELGFFLNGRPITGVLAAKAASPLLESCTFQAIPPGREYVPAVSLRSGATLSFNFGSSPFKYRPEGFSSLGVPDSWNERMDVFYNNATAATTQRRLQAMREAWRVLSPAHLALNIAAGGNRGSGGPLRSSLRRTTAASAQPSTPAATDSLCMEDMEQHLLPYRLIVQATDAFSDDGAKAFTKSGEEQLREHLASYAYPDAGDPAASSSAAAAMKGKTWELFKVLKAVSNVTNALLPFLSLNTANPSLMTLVFLAIRPLLFRTVRYDIVESALLMSTQRSEQLRLSINRVKAHADPRSVKASVFGQTFALLAGQPPRMFQTRHRFWNTVFLGEGAEDAGGPFREHLSEMCRELMSDRLPFFVRTANHVHNTGTHREAYVPAASASTAYELEAFAFLGRLMGGALRTGDPLDLFLPPLVWRYLCAYRITEAEVEQVDAICVQCIREFRKLEQSMGAAEAGEGEAAEEEGGGAGEATDPFEAVFGEEFFTTQLSDHSSVELIEGGAQTRVTLRRSREYAEALLRCRVHEFDQQLGKLREGLLSVVPEVVVLLLTPEELERRICGQPDYSPEELRKDATYEGIPKEDRRVQLLWKALEAATPKQRRLFLRFVSGRDRLPVKLRILPLVTQADPDTVLPRAATCFFAVELPDYSSLDVMKRKLFYSIENCADIDTDFNARIVDEDEAPQLSVGLEETQADLMEQLSSEPT